jgi:hypothetical protein
MLTIKSQHSIAMQIMISTICMLHAIIAQVVSKNSHTTSCIHNTDCKVALCCVSSQPLRLVILNGLTSSRAMKYFEVNNYVTKGPVLNVMKSGCGVSGIIATVIGHGIVAGNISC